MERIKALFFDTYALYEIIEGNKNYCMYTTGIGIITTKLNLMELCYGLLKDYGVEKAEQYYDFLLQYCIEINDDTIKEAMMLKLKNKKLSYVDCIGYTLARQFGVPFLTGDNEFKGMKNVEFKK